MKQIPVSKFTLTQNGYTFADEIEYSDEQKRKREFVRKYLEPAVIASNCGWKSVRYYLMKCEGGYHSEQVVLGYNENDPTEGNYICVSMDSLTAIMSEVVDNIYS